MKTKTTPLLAAAGAATLLATFPAQAASPALPAALGLVGGIFVDQVTGPESDVGLIDYGFVTPADLTGERNNPPPRCVSLKAKFQQPDNSGQVAKDDIYEVVLKRIKLGSDIHTRLADALETNMKIAVVAKGFQMASSPGAQDGFDYSPTSANAGRVVYYSDDVRKEQALSFGQLIMFGPVQYNGNPVGVSLYVIKLANEGGKMGPLLSSLATLGKSVGGNVEVLGILETLGTRLLNGQDVRYFRFDTMLGSQANSVPNLYGAYLTYGDYVLIRREDRSKPIQVSSYRYDPQTARLYSDEHCENPVTDLSYGVIQVNRGSAEAFMKWATYDTLRTAVAQAGQNSDPKAATAALAKVQASLDRNFLVLAGKWKSPEVIPTPEQKIRLAAILDKVVNSVRKTPGTPTYPPDDLERMLDELTYRFKLTVNRTATRDDLMQKFLQELGKSWP